MYTLKEGNTYTFRTKTCIFRALWLKGALKKKLFWGKKK